MRRKYPPLTPDEVIRILKARGFTNPDKPEPKRRQPPLPKSLHKKREFRGLGTCNVLTFNAQLGRLMHGSETTVYLETH